MSIQATNPFDVDDVAISGLSGRFTGSKNINELKEKLYNGQDVITTDNVGATFLEQLDKFDATIFGISEEQAQILNPQSRMLLQTAYECIIDAGYNFAEMRESNTGVFIGLPTSGSSYRSMQDSIKTISSVFHFFEPSAALEVSAESFLHAISRAVAAIREGMCDSAIAVGGSLRFSPEGGVRSSESVLTVFLQKPRDARRAYATVVNVGTNVNDCKPNEQSQWMRQVYRECNVKPANVSYVVMAHGNGSVIDYAEDAKAIADLFCSGRTGPLLIGAGKSNVDHAKSAGSVCAVIEALLAMESGIIPAHFNQPHPNIPALIDGRMKFVDSPTPLNGDLIAIHNIEYGGTNAHLLLRHNPKLKITSETAGPSPSIVTVSGRTESAVNKMIDRVTEHSTDPELLALVRNIYSANINGHRYRGFQVQSSSDFETVREVSEIPTEKRPVWYVFSGMSTQWVGMGQSLMSIEVFRHSMERSAAVLKTQNFDLLELIWNGSSGDIANIANVPPCIVAIQIALVDVLTACGIEPDGIVGHSLGETTAGYADGAFTAEQTILAAYFRGKCIAETKMADGRMGAVGLTWEETKRRCTDGVYPACHNGIDTVVISGLHEPMAKFVEELESEGVFAKMVNVAGVAFHSKYVEEAAKPMLLELQNIIPTPKRRSPRWISSSVPESQWREELPQYCSADYVINNVVSPVLFYEAMLHVPNNAIIVEIGPEHVLSVIMRRSFSPKMTHVPLQKANHVDNTAFLLTAMGKLYMAGVDIHLSNLYPNVSYPVGRGTPMISPFIEWD